METTRQRFEALSRICLNNWHYIDKRVLSFHEGINFFTGHSGSGKSTVIDALQILLYADSDGRGFFNKAAADDSDRSLIEYLRGMVNIGEDGQYSYLRNKNFSTTIVMELKRTDTGECQSIGVAFDVETAANAVNSRLFFWHQGPLLESFYRVSGRAMATDEIREYLQKNFEQNQYYFGPSNERFRKQLYDVYLGGLNEERFPQLFRRAIPFRMKIKLEEFVKEYICMEEDIRIEDMQESVLQYGRMRKKIGDTCREIEELKAIQKAHGDVEQKEAEQKEYAYMKSSMELRKMREQVTELQLKIGNYEEDKKRQLAGQSELEQEIAGLEERSRELERQIAASGYDELKERLAGLNELIERLSISRAKWDQTTAKLKLWEDQDMTPNPVLWDIERFEARDISEADLRRLQESLKKLNGEAEKTRRDLDGDLRQMNHQLAALDEDLKKLRQGGKAYPKEVEAARNHIIRGLQAETGKPVPVEVLADLLEVPDDTWRNAVEGYMGNNKLLLVVEPKYARQAMKLYEELDPKTYYTVSVLDTEKVTAKTHTVQPGALAEEVTCSKPYVRSYVDYLMGNVIKCGDIDELRRCNIGITSSCELYHGYKLQHINPANYTRFSYIGKEGRMRRVRQLEKEIRQIEEKKAPLEEQRRECLEVLELETLGYPAEEYLGWQQDMAGLSAKKQEQKRLMKKLEVLQSQNVDTWRTEQEETDKTCRAKKELRDGVIRVIESIEKQIRDSKERHIGLSTELAQMEAEFLKDQDFEEKVRIYLEEKAQKGSVNYEALRAYFFGKENTAAEEKEARLSALREIRFQYLKAHPNRSFSAESKDNREYDQLLEHLQYADLESFYKKADEQAKEAVNLFKQDFVYKIRAAIQGAMARRDELNDIIDRLDFGKDKYRFRFTKNKGPDGKYYDMFMAEDLNIDPSTLRNSMDNQMNMFTISHENRFGDQINELIGIFIPPDNASAEELEEAKQNISKYSDYRTYLSFEMEQIITGVDTMKIPLSKMIKKNSGGEGQNPLYVALLASFAQAYRINGSSRLQRNPTIRLVVLDEAFSKMDAEKVGSCIKLIRGFGFQAIISATNDKIQNYLESVDKTFVFANPNKKHISIQEFEKSEFEQLSREAEELVL